MPNLLEPSNYKIFQEVQFAAHRLLRTAGVFTEKALCLQVMRGSDEIKVAVLKELVRGKQLKIVLADNTKETIYQEGAGL